MSSAIDPNEIELSPGDLCQLAHLSVQIMTEQWTGGFVTGSLLELGLCAVFMRETGCVHDVNSMLLQAEPAEEP